MSINKYSNFTPGHEECIVQVASKSSFCSKNYISGVALECTDVTHPSEQTEALKKSESKGHLYLTNKQLVWINKQNNKLKSFSCSFSSIKDFKLKQPMFGANLIKLSCVGEPGECGFKGQVDLKLTFNDGGAVDFGRCLIQTQKNPPRPNQFQSGLNQPTFNQPMIQMPNGQFHLPAGVPMAGTGQNNWQAPSSAPPTYDNSGNDPGVVAPPQYFESSSNNTCSQQQNFPGQNSDKSREAGF